MFLLDFLSCYLLESFVLAYSLISNGLKVKKYLKNISIIRVMFVG